jgi:hypothetical protein
MLEALHPQSFGITGSVSFVEDLVIELWRKLYGFSLFFTLASFAMDWMVLRGGRAEETF